MIIRTLEIKFYTYISLTTKLDNQNTGNKILYLYGLVTTIFFIFFIPLRIRTLEIKF